MNIKGVKMPITFPNDKTGIIDPGTGELETGDLYRASNGVLYEYNASDGSWTGPTELGGTGEPEDGVPFPLPRNQAFALRDPCLLYTSPSPRDRQKSRMPSSA